METSNLITVCPYCEFVADSQLNLSADNHRPEEGDLSICSGCGALAVFDGQGALLRPSEAQVGILEGRPDFWKIKQVQEYIRAAKKE